MKHLKLYENFVQPIISYDFDGVLHTSVKGIHPIDMTDYDSWEPFVKMHEQLKKDALNNKIVIVTARPPLSDVKNAVQKFLAKYDLPVEEIYYTDDEPKIDVLKQMGAVKHYDDNPDMFDELRGSGIEFEFVKPDISEALSGDAHKHALKRNKEHAKKYGFNVQDDYVIVYHGTNKRNMDRIIKSNMLKAGTWMSPNIDVAKKYSLQSVSRSADARVDTFVVYLGSLTYFPNEDGGYFQSNEDLYFMDGKYVPDGFKYGSQLTEKDEFRDAHVAPGVDDRPAKEKIDDHGDFNLAEVAQGYHSQPDDYFSPQGARFYMYDTLEGRQSYTAINNFIRYFKAHNEIPDRTITTYRAIPKKITANKLMPGDWVTFSEEYAIKHGEHRFGEDNYKIIKQDVSPYHVWWDSNDINEWGYDDSLSESLNEMMDGYRENGIVLLINHENRRLYGARIKKVLSRERKKVGGEEGLAAKMVLLSDDMFRILRDSHNSFTAVKVMNGNKAAGIKSKNVVLNSNKTPLHWTTTKYSSFPTMFKDIGDALGNLPDIKWYN